MTDAEGKCNPTTFPVRHHCRTDEFATENFSNGCENDCLVIEAHWHLVLT